MNRRKLFGLFAAVPASVVAAHLPKFPRVGGSIKVFWRELDTSKWIEMPPLHFRDVVPANIGPAGAEALQQLVPPIGPTVIGKMRVYPPFLAPPYTTLAADRDSDWYSGA